MAPTRAGSAAERTLASSRLPPVVNCSHAATTLPSSPIAARVWSYRSALTSSVWPQTPVAACRRAP